MSDEENPSATREEKLSALADVAYFDPKFTLIILGLGMIAAVLEGIGLTFILPIIEVVQSSDPVGEADGLMAVFVSFYQTLGLPFTLGFVVLGVAVVMVFRFTASFAVAWFREALRTYYIRDLQLRAFDRALDAEIQYFDEEGTDDILNAIITQTYYAGRVIMRVVRLLETVFISTVYFLIALFIAPILTVLSIIVLGFFTVVLRGVVEPGYEVGERNAEANERRQAAAQAGTQGIRDIRIFGLAEELYDDFVDAVDLYTKSRITLRRNEAAIKKFYKLAVSVSVFALIYFALTFTNLSFGSLGLFLFAMFRLGPRVSSLNNQYYKFENDLPHLVRTQNFIRDLEDRKEPASASRPTPSEIERVEFDDVSFSYDGEEPVLRDLDFEVEKGEFVAFVGQSGAGKSTIVALLARFYEADHGHILANGEPITEMDPEEWRKRLAIVRQSPFVFNETLKYNLRIGNRDASREEMETACEIAKVDEFLDELPNGYDSMLGEEGVRLSGGQKQRVALARALLTDADILVLDEATSDLDSNLEKEVQRAIEEMDREYAIITIAHRLSTVENADRIYTMVDGQISETGAHGELVENDGKYAELYTIQST